MAGDDGEREQAKQEPGPRSHVPLQPQPEPRHGFQPIEKTEWNGATMRGKRLSVSLISVLTVMALIGACGGDEATTTTDRRRQHGYRIAAAGNTTTAAAG